MGEKRVIEQVASNVVHNDDWFLKDSPTQDTSKISATNLKAILGADGTLALEEIANAIAEEYNPSATYNKGAYVFYEGTFYKCKQNGTTGTWDASKWEATSVINLINSNAGDITELEYKSNNAIAMNHSTIATYNKGDYVFYWFHLYRCLEDDVYGAWDDSKWEEVNIPEYIDYVLENAGKVDDVTVDGTSVVTNKVAEIEIPVKDVQVKTDSTYDSVVDASGNAKIDISGKANTSGYYEDFVAGTAENLMADNYTEDKVPYNFRQSFNGARLEDEIVGGTVAWNQLVPTASIHKSGTPSSGTWATSLDFALISGHKILLTRSGKYPDYGNSCRVVSTTGTTIIYNQTTPQGGTYQSVVFSCTESRDNYYVQAWIKENEAYDFYLNVIDLTQAFGSTIADYVYSLEQATAGSGIAWLKANGFLTKDYYSYDAGSLQSVKTSGRKIVGKNLFDIHIDKDTSYTNIILDKPLDQTFTVSAVNNNVAVSEIVWRIGFVYKNNEVYYVGDNGYQRPFPQTIIATESNPIVKIQYRGITMTSGSYDVQIEFGQTATTYEPYKTKSYPLDSDLTLRGIPKLDANNNLYYDGDTYESDGSVKRRFGVVDLGSLSWSYVSSGDSMRATIADAKSGTTNFVSILPYTASFVGTSLRIYETGYTDTDAFKTAMNGVYLIYEVATPTSETADAFATPQIVNPKGTEEYVDYAESQGTRDVAIPVGHNSKYYADLKAKIEDIPEVPNTNGTYTLKATRSASGVAYNWISD